MQVPIAMLKRKSIKSLSVSQNFYINYSICQMKDTYG